MTATYSFVIRRAKDLDIQRVIAEAPAKALFIQLRVGEDSLTLVSPLAQSRMEAAGIRRNFGNCMTLRVTDSPRGVTVYQSPSYALEGEWGTSLTEGSVLLRELRTAERLKTTVQVTALTDADFTE